MFAADQGLETVILKWLHVSLLGGHSGRDTTASRVKSLFFWKGMKYEQRYPILHRKLWRSVKQSSAYLWVESFGIDINHCNFFFLAHLFLTLSSASSSPSYIPPL